MKRKKIVVALGHKALGTTLPEQKAAVKRSAKVIADLVAAGADVVITHSNAPQVGMIHMAMNEFGKMHTDYAQPRCLSAPLERRLHRLRPAERHPC